MEWIKLHWKEIVIGLLVIFGLRNCTTSCTNDRKYKEAEFQKRELETTQNVLKDSIVVLNTRIQVYEEKIAGLSQSLSIQEEASKRISEAKKNINVNVRNVE